MSYSTLSCIQSREFLVQKKACIRKSVLAQRNALPQQTRTIRSRVLCENIIELLSPVLSEGSLLAAYASLGSEPDTSFLIQEAYRLKWRVCFPCMISDPSNGLHASSAHMVFVEVKQDLFDAHTAPFLVRPAQSISPDHPIFENASLVHPAQFDAIVVPLVAFDGHNNRLGYGGGNYDRFLSCVRDDAIVLGAAFCEQQVDEVPCEEHDRPLSHIEIA